MASPRALDLLGLTAYMFVVGGGRPDIELLSAVIRWSLAPAETQGDVYTTAWSDGTAPLAEARNEGGGSDAVDDDLPSRETSAADLRRSGSDEALRDLHAARVR